MQTKLTLLLEKNIIEKAKNYSKKRNISLSKLIENFFLCLEDIEKKNASEITPFVKKLSGSIKLKELKEIKDERYEYLMEKHK